MRHELDGRKLVKNGAIILGLVFILGYALYAAFPLLLGPSITVHVETEENATVRVYGATKRVSLFTINGSEVPLDTHGNFDITRAYPSGYTVLTARGQDRFGHAITKHLTFVVP